MSDTAMVPRKPADGDRPARRPLIDEQLADQLLGKAAALIRRLDTGQTAYIYRGGVTFVPIKRLVAAPAALAGEPVAPGGPDGRTAATPPAAPAAGGEPGTAPPPDAGSLLDEAFGDETG